MRVVLYMAMSVNGIVARSDGDEDCLADSHWAALGGYAREHGGCLIVGRRTVEAVATWGASMGFQDFPDVRKVVVTSDDAWPVPEGFVRARSPQDALALLEREGCTSTLLTGGPTLNRAFAEAGLINVVIFRLEPAFIGGGMPVIAQGPHDLRLELDGAPRAAEGIVTLQYRVVPK